MDSDFKVIRDGNTLNILLGRDLSVANAGALTDELSKYIGQGIESVVFDATGLVFLSSSGIRSLLFAYQELSNQPEIVFENCAKEIYEVLDIVGLTAFIKFKESLEKKVLYRKRVLNDMSIEDAEQIASERKKELEKFVSSNDMVCYSMKMGEEDS